MWSVVWSCVWPCLGLWSRRPTLNNVPAGCAKVQVRGLATCTRARKPGRDPTRCGSLLVTCLPYPPPSPVHCTPHANTPPPHGIAHQDLVPVSILAPSLSGPHKQRPRPLLLDACDRVSLPLAGSMPRSVDVILRHAAVDRAKAGDKCTFNGVFAVADVLWGRIA
jgi:hypothetical protein